MVNDAPILETWSDAQLIIALVRAQREARRGTAILGPLGVHAISCELNRRGKLHHPNGKEPAARKRRPAPGESVVLD
jgi:hypothetical protein